MNRTLAEMIQEQKLVTLLPDATVQDACRRMHADRIGAVLVTADDGQLLGIFTGRDAVRAIAETHDFRARKLRHRMTKSPANLPPGARAIDALRLMRDGGFRHVPVVQDGIAIGIVSHFDFRGLEKDRLDEEIGLWERMA